MATHPGLEPKKPYMLGKSIQKTDEDVKDLAITPKVIMNSSSEELQI
ncbi:hypothetical protein ACP70R_043024 [Stipagrostis hirtigluma subsp. patula]